MGRTQPPASAPEAEPTPGNPKGGWKHSGFLPMDLSSGPPGGSVPPAHSQEARLPHSATVFSWDLLGPRRGAILDREGFHSGCFTNTGPCSEESPDPACIGLAMGPPGTQPADRVHAPWRTSRCWTPTRTRANKWKKVVQLNSPHQRSVRREPHPRVAERRAIIIKPNYRKKVSHFSSFSPAEEVLLNWQSGNKKTRTFLNES